MTKLSLFTHICPYFCRCFWGAYRNKKELNSYNTPAFFPLFLHKIFLIYVNKYFLVTIPREDFMNNKPNFEQFVFRHIGPDQQEVSQMLKEMNLDSLDALIDQTVPSRIRLKEKLPLKKPMTEYEFTKLLDEILSENKIFKSYIGMGYHPVITPSVIQRNILENPGWYTQYTPYQAEISQGRLEALLNFQTMIIDLTGLPVANASLLDEGTAAAEAMAMLYNARKGNRKNSGTLFVSEECLPQTIDVLRTRSSSLGVKILIGNHKEINLTDDIYAVLLQYPAENGAVYDYRNLITDAKGKDIAVIVAADLMSLVLLTPPGEFGADVVVGSTQRFGVPMGYGGPHAAFFAVKEEYKRIMPGRIIGISVDADGNRAYRMALQTREQHIRREKATSNICTSQALLAIMASMYAVYHGAEGIKRISERIHLFTAALYNALKKVNIAIKNSAFYDTLELEFVDSQTIEKIKTSAEAKGINFRYKNKNGLGLSISETTTDNDLKEIFSIIAGCAGKDVAGTEIEEALNSVSFVIPEELKRKSAFLTSGVFNRFHSETEFLRYVKNLEKKDLSLTSSMIPLGSCTMKLNGTTEMIGITRPELANLHPFAPAEQAKGYKKIIDGLSEDLCKITGFKGISLQPNSGAQGEFSGLMVIRQYHISTGQAQRNVVLIPSSAHGTNPASAVMAGMKVTVVNCDDNGNIDVEDLKNKAVQNKENLAALMVTYPSTHGVFEEQIMEMCDIIHENGGQVYMDGANMNAQVGLTSPAVIGADICHLNLHKTFSIPHGGGGPGVGPIAAAEHLVPFLPNHCVVPVSSVNGITAVSSAPYGSAGVLVISYAYIKMMGEEGLTAATKAAILNANYIKEKLSSCYKTLYTGVNGRVAHEMIFDFREFKNSAGVEVEDVAKRLMDYGFHAPTVSFPVHGTLMIEPTESESKYELDRFCEALVEIRNEIREIEEGIYDGADNVLKNSPHTAESLICSDWNHKYSREKAAYPVTSLKLNKFWPAVARINNAYGDRNLVCSCNPVSDYAK
jgi:glycine dehydrogenase